MKTKENKKNLPMIFIIILSVTAIAFLLTALLLALPKLNADKRLHAINDLIASGSFDSVIVYQHTPFDTGSFEQVSQVFEKKLDDGQAATFSQILSDAISKSDYTGSSESYYAMTDYKIIITQNGQRNVFYVSEDSIYILDGSLKTAFECKNNPLYEFLNSIKKSHFE